MKKEFAGGEGASLSERPSRSTYWLIVERGQGRMGVFVTELGGEERVLPVFSFKEEAEMFLECEAGSGWQVRETGCGELISLLHGLCRSVEYVTLDPLPKRSTEVEAIGLMSMERERFVEGVVNRGGGVPAPRSGLKRPAPKPEARPEARARTRELRGRNAGPGRTPEGSR